MKNDDEDDDYMSDKILQSISDTRPGLLSKSQSRQFNIEKKQEKPNELSKSQPGMKLEEIKRNEALSKSIIEVDKNNKGLSLMKKMGFKAGMTLGKVTAAETSTTRDRIIEPIGIKLKVNREGLGCDEEKKRKADEYTVKLKRICIQKQVDEELNRNLFLSNKKIQFEFKKIKKSFYKAQRICHQFDTKEKLEKPLMGYYWPRYVQKKHDSEEEDAVKAKSKESESESDEEIETYEELKDKFDKINVYLREKYFYCIWCTVNYSNLTDLSVNCPGLNEDDHDF